MHTAYNTAVLKFNVISLTPRQSRECLAQSTVRDDEGLPFLLAICDLECKKNASSLSERQNEHQAHISRHATPHRHEEFANIKLHLKKALPTKSVLLLLLKIKMCWLEQHCPEQECLVMKGIVLAKYQCHVKDISIPDKVQDIYTYTQFCFKCTQIRFLHALEEHILT